MNCDKQTVAQRKPIIYFRYVLGVDILVTALIRYCNEDLYCCSSCEESDARRVMGRTKQIYSTWLGCKCVCRH